MSAGLGTSGPFDAWWRSQSGGVLKGFHVWCWNGITKAVFDSAAHTADEMPDLNVQIVRLFGELSGRMHYWLMDGYDEYWLPDATRPKFGFFLTDRQFEEITRDCLLKNGHGYTTPLSRHP